MSTDPDPKPTTLNADDLGRIVAHRVTEHLTAHVAEILERLVATLDQVLLDMAKKDPLAPTPTQSEDDMTPFTGDEPPAAH